MGLLIRSILLVLLLASPAWATTYWVDDNGTKTTATDCDGADPISGADACTLTAANGFAAAGDTVYLRAGTYTVTGNGIVPTNTGSAGSLITFSGYEAEAVTIVGAADATGKSSRGIYLNGKSYIKITKIAFSNMYQGLVINGGGHNEVSYCTFTFRDAWAAGENGVYTYDPAGIDIGGNSTHNWVHHNVMHGLGGFDSSDQGVLFAIGATQLGTAEENSNNTVELNHIYHGGHHVFAVNYGFYNVVRNNYMHNEGWFSDAAYDAVCASGDNGVCGYRVLYSQGDTNHVGRTLYEGNFIGYADQYGRQHVASGGPGGGMNVANDNNIIRYNDLVGNVQYGYSGGTSLSSPVKDGENNRIYNNTFFQNGYNYISYGVTGGDNTYPEAGVDMYRTHMLLSDADVSGNVIKNNLFHNSWSETNKLSNTIYYPSITAGTANNVSNNTFTNNYVTDTSYVGRGTVFTDTVDPLFTSETLPDDSAAIIAAWSSYAVTSPDLTLGALSPAKDQGTYLTTVHADDTSSGTTLILTDASFFQAGSAAATSPMGSSLSTVAGDYIKVGATVAAADETQITDINYTTNTLTINPAIERADGEYVWLSRKSDGGIVLYNAAPDMGAHEIVDEGAPDTYYTMTVTEPTNGTITTPEGINCGTSGDVCTYNYLSTANAVMTFTPDSGYRIINTGGSCSGATSPQTIAMSEARTCSATFEKGIVLGTGNTLTLGTGNTITLQ